MLPNRIEITIAVGRFYDWIQVPNLFLFDFDLNDTACFDNTIIMMKKL